MSERRPAAELTALPGRVANSSRNPYLVALVAVGAFAWVLAFMLWNVLVQVTDFTTYDLETASALTIWVNLLLLSGVTVMVGAVVIAGVGRELRNMTSC